jgi:phosphatidylglycerophosphatase GEP4
MIWGDQNYLSKAEDSLDVVAGLSGRWINPDSAKARDVALRILKLSLASSIFFELHISDLSPFPTGGEPMDMNTLNVSATLNVFRLLTRPTLCLPHATVSTFNHLPIPLNKAFGKYEKVDIRAVVLDKDNCFAIPNSNEIHKPYNVGP